MGKTYLENGLTIAENWRKYAEKNGVEYHAFYSRIIRGMSIEEAAKRKVLIKELWLIHGEPKGINYETFRYRFNKGMPIEQACVKTIRYKEMWRKHGEGKVNYETFTWRMKQGETAEEAGNNKNRMRIKKPDFFTKDWYVNKKAKKVSDQKILKELFVSLTVLKRWKEEVGL